MANQAFPVSPTPPRQPSRRRGSASAIVEEVKKRNGLDRAGRMPAKRRPGRCLSPAF
jgi:hypothetical protein